MKRDVTVHTAVVLKNFESVLWIRFCTTYEKDLGWCWKNWISYVQTVVKSFDMGCICLPREHSLRFSFPAAAFCRGSPQRVNPLRGFCRSWCYLGSNPEPQDYEASAVTTEPPRPMTAGRLADEEKSHRNVRSSLNSGCLGVQDLNGQVLKITAYFCEKKNCIVGCAHYFATHIVRLHLYRCGTTTRVELSNLRDFSGKHPLFLQNRAAKIDSTTLEINVNSF